MTKTKFSEVLALLLVVALAPASIAFAQTSANDDAGVTTETKPTDSVDADTRTDEQKRNDKLKEDLKRTRDSVSDKKTKNTDRNTDKIRDANTDRIRDKVIDKAAELTYKGKTSGWAILGGVAFPSSIGISGEGYNQGSGNWRITAVGDIAVADRTAKLDLKGHVKGNQITLQGTGTLSDGTAIKIHLKGHYAPTSNTSEFAIAFTNSHIQYMDNGARIPLMQVGSVVVTPIVTPVPVPTTPAQ